MRRILIADVKSVNENGKSPGHYFAVAKNYEEIFDGICEVKIVGGPVYKQSFPDAIFLKHDTNSKDFVIKQKNYILNNCWELFKNATNDYLVIQSNAVSTVYVALLFSKKKNNIFMIQYNQLSIDTCLKRLLYNCIKKKICGILCSSDEIGQAYGLPYCVIPDYCVTRSNLCKLKDKFSDKEYDFALIGLITKDKGTVDVARKLIKSSARVIIAGRPDNKNIKEELENIAKQSDNIRLEMGYISDDQYDKYIRKSRWCILNYTDAYSSHSSGVVFDILYRGTPVIGRRCKSLLFVAKNNLGIVYDSLNNVDFEKILKDNKDIRYSRNIVDYLKTQLDIPDRIYDFIKSNRKY